MYAALQQSCPGCIETSSPALFEGMLWGMVIMTATPFFLLLVVGGGLFYARRQSMRRAVENLLADETRASADHQPGVARGG